MLHPIHLTQWLLLGPWVGISHVVLWPAAPSKLERGLYPDRSHRNRSTQKCRSYQVSRGVSAAVCRTPREPHVLMPRSGQKAMVSKSCRPKGRSSADRRRMKRAA